MTGPEFRATLEKLGFASPYAAAQALGVSRQQAYKLASGESNVTETMRLLLAMYRRFGVPNDLRKRP